MLSQLRAKPGIDHMLAVAALLLASVAIYPWLVSPSAPGAAQPANSGAKASAIVEPLPPLTTFKALFERPLFSPTRRPGPSGGTALGGQAVGRYRVLGIVSSEGAQRALLADGNARLEVTVGAVLNGRTIARIEHDRVVFASPDGEVELKLDSAQTTAVKPAATDRAQ